MASQANRKIATAVVREDADQKLRRGGPRTRAS